MCEWVKNLQLLNCEVWLCIYTESFICEFLFVSVEILKCKICIYQITGSDVGHAKKALYGHLTRLSATHKLVTKTVNDYLAKCFGYVLTQNKWDAEGIRQGCRVILKHAFGDHSLCQESWCKYLQNPETYKHQSLPHGKDLEGDDLKSDLEQVEWNVLSNSTILIFKRNPLFR